MKICHFCNNQITDDNTTICPFCGKMLNGSLTISSISSTQTNQTQSQPQQPQPSPQPLPQTQIQLTSETEGYISSFEGNQTNTAYIKKTFFKKPKYFLLLSISFLMMVIVVTYSTIMLLSRGGLLKPSIATNISNTLNSNSCKGNYLDEGGPIKISYMYGADLFITDTTGITPVLISSKGDDDTTSLSTSWFVSNLSPDQNYLAYHQSVHSKVNDSWRSTKWIINLVDLKTYKQTQIYEKAKIDDDSDFYTANDIKWTSDNKIILFVTHGMSVPGAEWKRVEEKIGFDLSGNIIDAGGLVPVPDLSFAETSPDNTYTLKNVALNQMPTAVIQKVDGGDTTVELAREQRFIRWVDNKRFLVKSTDKAKPGIQLMDICGNTRQVSNKIVDEIKPEKRILM